MTTDVNSFHVPVDHLYLWGYMSSALSTFQSVCMFYFLVLVMLHILRIFSHSLDCHFHLLIKNIKKVFSGSLIYLFFLLLPKPEIISKKSFTSHCHEAFALYFLLIVFQIYIFYLGLAIFELNFIYCVRKGPNFILSQVYIQLYQHCLLKTVLSKEMVITSFSKIL
jgi:hypothetical protein